MIWRTDFFPVSKRIENKLDYHYVGIGSKQLGKKKGGEGPGEEWVAWITIMFFLKGDWRKSDVKKNWGQGGSWRLTTKWQGQIPRIKLLSSW